MKINHKFFYRCHLINIDNEQEEQIKKKSYTSFGKLILAEEKSKPMYSFGKAERFPSAFSRTTKNENNKKKKDLFLEEMPDVKYYKYAKGNEWVFGTGKRRPLTNNEIYEYFKHKYDKKTDLAPLQKEWEKIIGGDIGRDSRIKYDFREKTPGPGRYMPQMKYTRPKSASYYIGEKIGYSSLKLFTGTDRGVGPGKYRPETAAYHSHHPKFPIYSIGKGLRPPLYPKPNSEGEHYWCHSSMGVQLQSSKKTESIIKFGDSTRDKEKLRGTFNTMMERRPAKVRIPMPKL